MAPKIFALKPDILSHGRRRPTPPRNTRATFGLFLLLKFTHINC